MPSKLAPHPHFTRSPAPPQKSPILTPEEQEARRREAEARLEEELAAAKQARAERAAAAAEAERRAVEEAPKTEMERLREQDRLRVISRAQLALLVRGKRGREVCGCGRRAATCCLHRGCRLRLQP